MNQYLERTIKKLPDSPGVYIYRDAKGNVLYVGKATSLKKRVSSYFQKAHDARIEQMVGQIAKIEVKQTRSALEALFLEAELIKKHQAKYNIMSKDDKTFAYIAFTKEPIPRIVVTRPTMRGKFTIAKLFGPYQSAMIARTALRILRRIFPFHTVKTKPGEKCFHASIGLCPGVCGVTVEAKLLSAAVGTRSLASYRRTLANIEMFFKGKRSRLEASLKVQMKAASRAQNYEEAARLRDSLRALAHINDVALLKEEMFRDRISKHGRPAHLTLPHRIEAYDISHTFGRDPVGSMVVFTDGKIDTSEYRKFRIRGEGKNDAEAKLPRAAGSPDRGRGRSMDDIAMLKEVLTRRLRHSEWPYPDLVLMDGGAAQLHAAHEVIEEQGLSIPAAALAKGPERKRADLYTADSSVKLIPLSLLIRLRDEAHRFAIRYHRTLRARRLLAG